MRGFSMIIGVCALFIGTPVTGLSFTSTPDRVVIGNTGTLTMTCSVTENDVKTLYDIIIKRTVTPGSTTFENIASFIDGTPTLSGEITNNKNFSVTGEMSENTKKLELSMAQSALTCSDARLYSCEAAYVSSVTSSIKTVGQNLTLQAFVLPQMFPPLQAKRNGNFIEGGTLSDKASFDVGDVLELQCRANIGSIDSVTIRWRKTSEMDDSQFNGYQPEEGTYDEGSPLSDNQCGYTRTATIRHNITAPVVGYDLAFECYVSVDGYPSSTLTPSGMYTTKNNLRYYIDVNQTSPVEDVNTGIWTPGTDTASSNTKSSSSVSNAGTGGGNVGAIVGGVIGGLLAIVIIVVVVWFLWFRRRDGETYTTKEEYGSENPNMAPPLDTYATVDKKKRGHENRGLDEPHESRRHHYQNGPGKSNYGMDRDADDYDSRDGSPTMTHQGISHMGMDPMDGRIGTGV